MKNILKFASIALLAVSGTACSLDSESMSSIDSQTFYTTMDDASLAVIGCYDGYRRTVAGGPTFSFYVLSELMGDDCFGGTGVADGRNHQAIDRFDKSQYPTVSNQLEGLWSYYYAAIFNVNSLMIQLDNIEWQASAAFNTSSPEETRAAVEGEIRFLRAIEYFDLVRLFGRVPLLTEPTEEVVAQSEPDKIFELIFEDLKFAAANIKYVPTKDWCTANDGRATSEAAKAMLARAYLFYTGYYGKEPANVTKEEVTQGLQDIVTGAHYALVQSDSNNGFARLWRAAVSTDAGDGMGLDNHDYVGRACENAAENEFIFTQKFNYTANYDGVTTSNSMLVMMGLRGVTNVAAVPYGRGWGACTVNPDSWTIFDDNDPRRAASIINISGEGRSAAIDDAVAADWREYTGYNIKKYIPLSYNVAGKAVPEVTAEGTFENVTGFQESQYQDYVVIRYADVLLMLSELTGDAQYMNQVRRRAGLSDIGYSLDNVMAERHRELLGEGIRYWDLLRQGINTAATAIAGTWTVTTGGEAETITIDDQNIIKTKGLLPIPDNQITLSNGVYTQNEGWN